MRHAVAPVPAGCAGAVRRLWEFLDGGLDAAEQNQVEAHLSWCVRCCGELAFATELQRLLRARTGGSPPPAVIERLERFVDDLEP